MVAIFNLILSYATLEKKIENCPIGLRLVFLDL